MNMSLSNSETETQVAISDVDVVDESNSASSGSASSSSSCFNFNDGSKLIVDFSKRHQRHIMRQERQISSSCSEHNPHTTNTNSVDSNCNGEGKGNAEDEDEEKMTSKTSPTPTEGPYKQVRFSDHIQFRSIPYPSKEELLQRWDSKEDKVIFKQQLARDVYSIRHLLTSTPMEALEKEVLYWCLGLEALVSVQVTRHVRRMRVEHSRSIVQMQHHLSDEQLAAYARRNSLQSRDRAQELAAGNWEILP